MKPALTLDVLICHFAYGGNGGIQSEHPDIREWELETVLQMKQDPRIRSVSIKTISDTPITMTRNKAVSIAKKMGVHLLLMVDSDQSPNKHKGEPWFKPFWEEAFTFIYERYQRGPNLVFAPYCGPPGGHENVFCFQWHDYGNNGPETAFSLEQYTREQAAIMTGMQECAAGATGMILFDMRCFDLIEPVPVSKRHILEQVQQGKLDVEEALMQLKEGYFYYEWKDHRADEKASTEDVTVTRDIALAGQIKLGYNPVHCAWDSWIGHHKPYNVGKPQRFVNEQVSATLRRAVLNENRIEDAIVEVQTLNRGSDTLARRLQSLANESLERFHADQQAHRGNGHARRPDLPPGMSLPLLPPAEGKTSADRGPAEGLQRWQPASDLAMRLAKANKVNPVIVAPESDRFSEVLSGYADQSIDFLFCDNVLHNHPDPCQLLQEIKRVAKAGWIEGPSPIAEVTCDLKSRNILWSSGSSLHLLRRRECESELVVAARPDLINEGPWYSRMYHLFGPEQGLQFSAHETIEPTARWYELRLRDACRLGICASREVYEMAAGEKLPPLAYHPWYDGIETPQEHLDLLRSYVRQAAEKLAGTGKRVRVIEVGSWLGKTAIAMADAGAEVHCIDHWRGSPSDPSHLHAVAGGGSEGVYAEFCKNIGQRLNKTIFPWRKSSLEGARMNWGPCDIAFIDAEHTYEAAKEDILAWWKHLDDDGVMIVHDYLTVQFPGVTEAVRELFGDVEGQATCGHGSFAVIRKADYPNLLETQEASHGLQTAEAAAV